MPAETDDKKTEETKPADKPAAPAKSTTPAKAGAKPAAKAAKAPKESPDQLWERTQRERAEGARDKANKEAARRAGMTTEQILQDDRKKAQEGQVEADRWNALSQEEQNKELADPKSAHYEPLPPWQYRLADGRIFDARAQPHLDLLATNGTVISGDAAKEATEFYVAFLETSWV